MRETWEREDRPLCKSSKCRTAAGRGTVELGVVCGWRNRNWKCHSCYLVTLDSQIEKSNLRIHERMLLPPGYFQKKLRWELNFFWDENAFELTNRPVCYSFLLEGILWFHIYGEKNWGNTRRWHLIT